MPKVKTWVSSYLPKQEELKNFCLIAVHQKVMALNSRDVEVVVHDQCFFMDFDLLCGDEGKQKE